MKLSERIRRDRQRYAALSPSEKRTFLWDYYKIPILALVCAVLLGGIALLEGLNSRSVAVYAVLVNAAPDTQTAQTCLEDLLTDSGMDLKGKRVDADVSLSLGRENQESEDAQTVQVLAALFGVSGLDFFAADEEIFDRYAVQNAFADLSKLLDPALLEAFSEDLVYATPEGGDRQVAGVRLHGGSPLHRSGLYSRDIVVGITVNGENMEAALQMLKEILVQTDP